jgi:hypothetical protein
MNEADFAAKFSALEHSLKRWRFVALFALLLGVGAVLLHFIPHNITVNHVDAQSLSVGDSYFGKNGDGAIHFNSLYSDDNLDINSTGITFSGNNFHPDPMEAYSLNISGRGIDIFYPKSATPDSKSFGYGISLGVAKYRGEESYEPFLKLQKDEKTVKYISAEK